MPKLPQIYLTDVKNISPLLQLLEQIAKQQYEIKVLTDNQVKVQPKPSETYRSIMKALAEKHGILHLQINIRKKLQGSFKKCPPLHQN
jgi:hypothetical protein